MVLNLARSLVLLVAAALIFSSAPLPAHKAHNQPRPGEPPAARIAAPSQPAGAPGTAEPMTGEMPGHQEMMAEERPSSLLGRLIDFLGRMHPFAVHFPIALIPTSWVALLLARRRGHAVDVLRAVIILAAAAAVVAALLGWFNQGLALAADDDVTAAHRWIGTGLAALMAAIGIWAWRDEACLKSSWATWALGGTTLLLLVQGWLGGAITHGMEHMMF